MGRFGRSKRSAPIAYQDNDRESLAPSFAYQDNDRESLAPSSFAYHDMNHESLAPSVAYQDDDRESLARSSITYHDIDRQSLTHSIAYQDNDCASLAPSSITYQAIDRQSLARSIAYHDNDRESSVGSAANYDGDSEYFDQYKGFKTLDATSGFSFVSVLMGIKGFTEAVLRPVAEMIIRHRKVADRQNAIIKQQKIWARQSISWNPTTESWEDVGVGAVEKAIAKIPGSFPSSSDYRSPTPTREWAHSIGEYSEDSDDEEIEEANRRARYTTKALPAARTDTQPRKRTLGKCGGKFSGVLRRK